MMKISRRILSFILGMILIFSLLSYTYDSYAYQDTYPLPELTGDQAYDVVEIARSQLGYREATDGTAYGKWYDATFTNAAWCAMFVSWCCYQARVPASVVKPNAAVRYFQSFFSSLGRYYEASTGYVPVSGDFVFYDNASASGSYNHIGIVLSYDIQTDYVTTIEGNTGDPTGKDEPVATHQGFVVIYRRQYPVVVKVNEFHQTAGTHVVQSQFTDGFAYVAVLRSDQHFEGVVASIGKGRLRAVDVG